MSLILLVWVYNGNKLTLMSIQAMSPLLTLTMNTVRAGQHCQLPRRWLSIQSGIRYILCFSGCCWRSCSCLVEVSKIDAPWCEDLLNECIRGGWKAPEGFKHQSYFRSRWRRLPSQQKKELRGQSMLSSGLHDIPSHPRRWDVLPACSLIS